MAREVDPQVARRRRKERAAAEAQAKAVKARRRAEERAVAEKMEELLARDLRAGSLLEKARSLGIGEGGPQYEFLRWLLRAPTTAWRPVEPLRDADDLPKKVAEYRVHDRAVRQLDREQPTREWQAREWYFELDGPLDPAEDEYSPRRRGRRAGSGSRLTRAILLFDGVLNMAGLADSADRRRLAYDMALHAMGVTRERRRRGGEAAHYVRDLRVGADRARDQVLRQAYDQWLEYYELQRTVRGENGGELPPEK